MRTIYPQPGYVEQDLVDLLATREFVYADCYTITPIIGSPQPLRYTTAQKDVIVYPLGEVIQATWRANELTIDGLRARASVGASVDTQEVELTYDEELRFQNWLTMSEALRRGRLDGAPIVRDRYFAATWGSPWVAGTRMFAGSVSDISKAGRQSAMINVNSSLVQLTSQAPRDLWAPQCKNRWADGRGCNILADDFAVQTTVAAGSTRTTLNWSGATDEFVMGVVLIEGSDNVTRRRTILNADPGVSVDLIYPLDFDPVAGENVVFYPNCRRQFDRCGDYHANPEEAFIGFPHVPVVESAA